MEAPIYHLEGVVKAKEESMEDFVGPLDLILHLLSKNKMEIKDIQIALILDQYLEWMAQRRELDLEVASDFVSMASHLVYIKTRMLLSIHDEEAMSEMEQLIATLEAHQRNENYLKIKDIVPELEGRHQVGQDCITKTPEPLRHDRAYRYVHQKEDLLKAITEVLRRCPPFRASWDGSPTRWRIRPGRLSDAWSAWGSPASAPCSGGVRAGQRWWLPSWRCWSCVRPSACV